MAADSDPVILVMLPPLQLERSITELWPLCREKSLSSMMVRTIWYRRRRNVQLLYFFDAAFLLFVAVNGLLQKNPVKWWRIKIGSHSLLLL
jgi:hypothetical protein